MKSFDLIVLGGGSGGLATAQRAVEHGARVAVFEPNRLGGTCVNVGCVPKKVMWNAAEIAHALADGPSYGFDVSVASHDWQRLKRGRDAYVERLNGIYRRNLDRKGIELVPRRGAFAAPHEIVDDLGERYSAPHIVIATGGYPKVPPIEGAKLGITSDGFFELEALPRRIAIVGSGYVSVELGGVLRALGSEVVLFVRYDRVLRDFDALLSDRLMAEMGSAGIEIVTAATPHALTGRGPFTLELEDGRRYPGFDAALWAIGRAPASASLALERAGLAPTHQGHVPVDDFQNTAVPGIYAVGDVTGRPELTPVAIAAGRRLADRVFGGDENRKLSYEVIPTVIFSHPPIGTVGLSEIEALRRHPTEPVYAYTAEFVPMFYALTERKPVTAMKLVVVGEEERVVGCHVIGPGADEILQGFAVAITMGARKRDLDDTIAIHPTSAEELVTMRTRVTSRR
ncbi:MAG TPA: glutathione-disulfide reductase [Gammaproteobacteria bacterium]|nr:glutathione-disulfide reductase [Gammaproteobacteria bacterium]